MRNEQSIRALCDQAMQTAFDLHGYLRNGHLENGWENGCLHPVKARLCCCSTLDQRDSKTPFVTFVLFVVHVGAWRISPLPSKCHA